MSLFRDAVESLPQVSDAALQAQARADNGVATQGLRAGWYGAKQHLGALGGNIAEALNSPETAAGMYDWAGQQGQQAELERAPLIHSYKDIGKHGSYLGDAAKYATGLFTESAMPLAAGLGAAALTRGKVNPFVAMTAATTPFTTGAQVVRQQADPNIAALPAGERLRTASAVGTGQAALMTALPVAAGRALKGVGAPVLEGLGAVPAASVGSELVAQQGLSALNPLRDTGQDAQALKESLAAGVAMGVPIAGVGAVRGRMNNAGDNLVTGLQRTAADLKGKAIDLGQKASEATKPSTGEAIDLDLTARAKELSTKAEPLFDGVRDTATTAMDNVRTKLGETDLYGKTLSGLDTLKNYVGKDKTQVAEDLATGTERVPPDVVAQGRDAVAQWLENNDQTRAGEAQKMRDELAAAGEQLDGLSDAEVAQKSLGRRMGETAARAVNGLQSFLQQFKKPDTDGNPKHSKRISGLDNALADSIGEYIPVKDQAVNAAGRLRELVQVAADEPGVRSPEKIAELYTHLEKLAGEDAPLALERVARVLEPALNEQQRANLQLTLDNLGFEYNKGRRLQSTVAKNLTPEFAQQLKDSGMTPKDLAQMVRDYTTKGPNTRLGRQEYARMEDNFTSLLREAFGDKAKTVLDAAENEYRRKDSTLADEGRVVNDSFAEADAPARSKLADEVVEGDVANQALEKANTSDLFDQKYHGVKDGEGMKPFLSAEAGMREYGRDASKEHMARARELNPDAEVELINAREWAKDNDVSPERLNEMTNGAPDDYQMVRVTKAKNELAATENLVKKWRADSRYEDSPGRIKLGTGDTVDAVKIARDMLGKLENIGEETGPQRTLRAFQEGVAALIEKSGKSAEELFPGTKLDKQGRPVFPDNLVIQAGKGKQVTLGEARKAIKERPEVPEVEQSTRTDQQLQNQIGRAQIKQAKLETEAKTIEGKYAGKEMPVIAKKRLGQLREEWADQQRLVSNLERALEARDTSRSADAMRDGAQELPATDNIHKAEAQHGDALAGEFAKQRDKQPVKSASPLEKTRDGVLTQDGREVLTARIRQVAELDVTPAPMRAIAKKFGALLREDAWGLLSVGERKALSRVETGGKWSEVAETVNGVYNKHREALMSLPKEAPRRPLPQGKQLEAPAPREEVSSPRVAQDRIAALVRGDDAAFSTTLERAKTTGDIDGLLKARQELLNAKTPNEARIKAIEGVLDDPKLAARHSERKPGAERVTEEVRANVEKELQRLLGDKVKVKLDETMPHAGEILDNTVKLSAFAKDPMSTGYHEALHGLIDGLAKSGDHGVVKALVRAADSTHVKNQLRSLLKNEPEALKQLDNAEERAAYMFEFWKAGELKLTGADKGVLTKVKEFIQKIAGYWTADQRAEYVMQQFAEGKYANPAERSAVARVALEKGRNKMLDRVGEMTEPLRRLGESVLSSIDSRLRDTDNASLQNIADLILARDEKATDRGWVPSATEKRLQYANGFLKRLGEMPDAAAQAEALSQLQTGKYKANNSPAVGRIIDAVRGTLDEMGGYLTEAGALERGLRKDYFPRVWDREVLRTSEGFDSFVDMLQKYKDAGKFDGDPKALAASVRDGAPVLDGTKKAATQFDAGHSRVLDFISGVDAEPFLNKNLLETMSRYIEQATKEGEYARRFGRNGEKFDALLKEAQDRYGATPDQIALARNSIDSAGGVYNVDKISSPLRHLMGNVTVYQNIRLLPLAIFSNLVDPMGITVRGGTVGDAFRTFKRGIAEIPSGFKENPARDKWYHVAEDIGAVENKLLQGMMADAYGNSLMSGTAQKINNAFFKYNLMEQYNRSVRVAATEAAARFIQRHAGSDNPTSVRWMDELGLKSSDVVKNGNDLAITKQDFMDAGFSDKEATQRASQMASALNKWVDGAVLRPNAAHRALWMNDPRFVLVAHLKQFTYAFQHVILGRVMREAEHGNYRPAMALAMYVPMMIALDAAKSGVTPGSSNRKDNWDTGDYVWNGVQRAGILSKAQFGVDAEKFGLLGLGGPTVSQLADAIRKPESSFVNALPANALYRGALQN